MSKADDWKDPVTITRKEYDELCKDQAVLNALYATGVDNWTGYDYALERLYEDDEALAEAARKERSE